MMRRAFLRMAGAGAAAAPFAGGIAAAAAPMALATPQPMSYGRAATPIPEDPVRRTARMALRAFEIEVEERKGRNALLGGFDPDIAAMKSWSPTARAQAMAERSREVGGTLERMRKSIWGDM